jgi:hypothetical protein
MTRFLDVRSDRVYIALVLLLAVCGGASSLVLVEMIPGAVALPASRPVLALVTGAIMLFGYGGLGLIGLRLSEKLGFPAIWDSAISNRDRFLIPAAIGAVAGLCLIVGDWTFHRIAVLPVLPHPAFPGSILASLSAGIGEEMLFRLFFIPFWMWVISRLFLGKRVPSALFWGVAIVSAIAFGVGHLPAIMYIENYKTLSEVPIALLAEILLLNGVVALPAAYYFRRSGFLAAVGIHFWTDMVWHVIWGVVVAV